jgi:ABC-2 type transport system ATP-binding protein
MITTIQSTRHHPPDSGVVAELRSVKKRYGEVEALNSLDLEVRRGEVLALLGPNGAGKTTVVNLMLGLVRPSRGEATLFGRGPQEVASRMRVGAMLQLSGVPETLTIREHLEVFSSYYPHPLPLAEVLARTGLTGLEGRLYGKLSGGQKQRLHLALALCGDPDLLFLDEPTTGLDVTSRRGLWDGVRSFIAEGKSVLLTTHYLEEADALADRIVVLNHGRVVAEGTPTEVKARTAGRRVRCVTNVALDLLRALPQVKSAKRDGAVTELLVTKAEPVVAELLRRDPDLSDLEVTGAGLEEAFLALTDERRGEA